MTACRKEVFKSILHYVQRKDNINDIIIRRDINQDIASLEVQEFYSKLGVKDIYQFFNYIKVEDLDQTYW